MCAAITERATCRLRIRRSAWEPALRRMLGRGTNFAFGSLRREAIPGGWLFLADELEVGDTVRGGALRSPQEDWCVVTAGSPESLPIDRLISGLQPRASQTLVLLLLDRQLPEACLLLLWHAGTLHPLDSCDIAGAGMLRLERHVESASAPDERRSSRTRGALGAQLHDRLRAATVTIVGTGRSGSQLGFLLAAAGVGRLRLVDADVLLPENLDGMPGLAVEDQYEGKASALAGRLLQFQPNLLVTCCEHPVNSTAARQVLQRPSDLLVSTVDNDTARLCVSLLANRTLTPHLDVGTLVRQSQSASGPPGLFADIRLLVPGSCVACVGGLADADAAWYELNAPVGSLQRGEPVQWSSQRSGSLAHLNTLACSIAVELWLQLLRGEIDSWWQRITWPIGGALQVTGSAVQGSEDCLVCGSAGRPA